MRGCSRSRRWTSKYSVKASRPGFATKLLEHVRVVTATPTSLRIRLENGEVTQQVEVRAPAALIQTTSTAITGTITGDQLQYVPLITKSGAELHHVPAGG